MLVNNPIHNACNYAVDSEYLSPPDSEQVRRGVVPLDSLPADWWNFFIKDASDGINEAQRAIQDYISEVKTLTTAAKIPENQECKDRIFCAIDVLRQTIATASLAGAVKSSDIKGQVSVNKDTGIMTANGVGNAEFTNMGAISGEGTKSYGTVTEAITGTRTETINVFTTVKGDINALKNGKAPTNHANAETIYGVGTADLYGHLKISDTYDSLVAGTGVAASQKALHCIYTQLQNMGAAPSNKAACAATENGTSGTSPNYSRGDHTHPYPNGLKKGPVTLPPEMFKPFVCPSVTAEVEQRVTCQILGAGRARVTAHVCVGVDIIPPPRHNNIVLADHYGGCIFLSGYACARGRAKVVDCYSPWTYACVNMCNYVLNIADFSNNEECWTATGLHMVTPKASCTGPWSGWSEDVFGGSPTAECSVQSCGSCVSEQHITGIKIL